MHPVLTEKLAAERIREMVARADAADAAGCRERLEGVWFPVAVPDASRSAGRAASSPAVWCQSTASLSCPDRADQRA